MIEEIKAFMRSRGLSDNVNIGTLLDELENLIYDIEKKMEIEGLSASNPVSVLLEHLVVEDETEE